MGLRRNDVTDDRASLNWKQPIPNTFAFFFFFLKAIPHSLCTFTHSLCLLLSLFLVFCQSWIRSFKVVANGHEDTRLSRVSAVSLLFNGLLSRIVWVRLWRVYSSLYILRIAFIPSLLKDISSMRFQAFQSQLTNWKVLTIMVTLWRTFLVWLRIAQRIPFVPVYSDLSNNRIGCLSPDMFQGLTNLTKL